MVSPLILATSSWDAEQLPSYYLPVYRVEADDNATPDRIVQVNAISLARILQQTPETLQQALAMPRRWFAPGIPAGEEQARIIARLVTGHLNTSQAPPIDLLPILQSDLRAVIARESCRMLGERLLGPERIRSATTWHVIDYASRCPSYLAECLPSFLGMPRLLFELLVTCYASCCPHDERGTPSGYSKYRFVLDDSLRLYTAMAQIPNHKKYELSDNELLACAIFARREMKSPTVAPLQDPTTQLLHYYYKHGTHNLPRTMHLWQDTEGHWNVDIWHKGKGVGKRAVVDRRRRGSFKEISPMARFHIVPPSADRPEQISFQPRVLMLNVHKKPRRTQPLDTEEMELLWEMGYDIASYPYHLSKYAAVTGGERALTLLYDMEEADSSLYDLLRNTCPTTDKLNEFMADLGAELERFHGLGFVHRDLRTRNFLVYGNRLRLADLGSAEPIGSVVSGSRRTCFTAPEQYKEPDKLLGLSDDIYCVGVILGEVYLQQDNLSYLDTSWLEVSAKRYGSSQIYQSDLYSLMADCLQGDPTKRPQPTALYKRLKALRHT